MALQYSKDKFGVTFPTAYAKIDTINYEQHKVDDVRTRLGDVIIKIYSNEASRNNNEQPLEVTAFSMEFQDFDVQPNLLVQAYDYMKASIPEFAGATDV